MLTYILVIILSSIGQCPSQETIYSLQTSCDTCTEGLDDVQADSTCGPCAAIDFGASSGVCHGDLND